MKKIFGLLSLLFVLIILSGCDIKNNNQVSSAAVPSSSLDKAKMEMRDVKRISDLKSIQNGLEFYYSDNQTFPEDLKIISTKYALSLDDPSGVPYKFKKSNDNYQLCFVLELGYGKFKKGESCFDKINKM